MNFELYGGEVRLEFQEGAHRYKVNGEYKEGVTTLLGAVTSKDGLIDWSAGLAATTFRDAMSDVLKRNGVITSQDIENAVEGSKNAYKAKRDSGGNIGTLVHSLVKDFIGQQLAGGGELQKNDNTQVNHCLSAFMKWHTEHNPEYLKSEQPIYSKQYDYAGTFDCLANIGGKLTMIDFKTANPKANYNHTKHTAYGKDFLQCAAYDQAYGEEHQINCEQYMLVYITKTGELYTYTSTETEENKQAWVSAIALARRFKHLENFS